MLAGAAGIGKTRILTALADNASASGTAVDRLFASVSARSIPLGAMASLVPPIDVDVTLQQVLATTVRSLAGAPISSHQGSAGCARLICVDDAHLLDEASATLVQLLAQQPGIALALSVRSGEGCPDALTRLWKDGLASRLDLQPLSEAEVGRLAELALGNPLDGATLRRLFQATRGNVLFLRELVSSGRGAGSLTVSGGCWRWRGPLALGSGLRDLIAQRLRELDLHTRSGLEVVALGEPLPLVALEALLDPATVDALELEHLVEVVVTGSRRTVRASHPLFSEAIRRSLPQRRADELRARIADAMQRTNPRLTDDELLRVVTLKLEAGQSADRRDIVASARRAWGLADASLTERLATAALEVGDDPEVHYLLGEVDVYRGRYDRALDRWRRLLGGDLPDHLRGRIATAAASLVGFNRSADAEELLADAIARVTDPAVRERLSSVRASLFVHQLPAAEVDRATSPVLSKTGASDEARVWAWAASARQRLMVGELSSVVEESEQLEAHARRARTEWPLAGLFVAMCRFYGLLLALRLDEAEAMARQRLDAALADRISLPRGLWSEALGLVAMTAGRLDLAARHLRAAVDMFTERDTGVLKPIYTEISVVEALRGRPEAARSALADADRSEQGMVAPLVQRPRCRAALLVADGNVSGARRLLREHAADCRSKGQTLFALQALHDLVRYGDAAGTVDALDEVARTFEGPLARSFAGQGRALAAGDGLLMVEAAEGLEAIGLELDAAETYAAATSALRAEGRAHGATAAARRSAALRRGCAQVVRTPLLSLADEHVAVLSERQREVAGLAAAGSSDAQIAGELFLSVRTVNAHLRSVYAKLGINSRSELPRALGLADRTHEEHPERGTRPK